MATSPINHGKRWSKAVASLFGIALVMLAFGWYPQGRAGADSIDRQTWDWILRHSGGPPERDDLVFLAIDDASLSLAGLSEAEVAASPVLGWMGRRFPWDRRVWAAVVDRLADSGAKLIVIDLVFSEPSDEIADTAFAETLERHRGKVLLASLFSPGGPDNRAGDVVSLIEPDERFIDWESDAGTGFVNFYPSLTDGLVRSARYTTTPFTENGKGAQAGETVFRSLAAQIIDVMGGEVPAGEHELRFSARAESGGADVYGAKSLFGIFHEPTWSKNYGEGRFFRDKVVMIGPSASRFHDIVPTPVGPITGPQMHLQAVACGMAGAFVRPVSNPWQMMAVLGGLSMVWTQFVRRPLVSTFGVIGLAAAVVAVVIWMAVSFSVLLPTTAGLIALVAGWTVAQSYELVTERLEKGRLRREFRRFVSRDVADALVEKPEQWREAANGVKRRVVVLFSDIRGFTARSETSDPVELVGQLNEYLTAMVGVVFRHGGTLDKFIGDAVMAHWGALGGGDDQANARAALAAARDMLAELERLSADWTARGRESFRIGIGIHLGEAVAGELGSPDRIEFGLIGDAVNLASRLEGLTKEFGCEVVFSDEVLRAAGATEAVDIGRVRVMGRVMPVALFGIGAEERIRQRLAAMERDADGVITMKSKS
jgi:adenylate cyclase